jgi:hypothetical protein
MSGRRGHERFAVLKPWDGGVSVPRDVAIQEHASGSLMVVTRLPVVAGETLMLDVSGGGTSATLRVRVMDSRPVTVDGVLQRALRLTVVDEVPPRLPLSGGGQSR